MPAEISFQFLKTAQAEGKIRHIGLSEVSVEDIKKAQEFFEVTSVQNRYSMYNRQWETVLDYGKQNHIAFIPWFPIGGGMDAKKEETIPHVADEKYTTVQQIALCWLLHHTDNILLISGTSNLADLAENMNVSSIELTEENMKLLDGIAGE